MSSSYHKTENVMFCPFLLINFLGASASAHINSSHSRNIVAHVHYVVALPKGKIYLQLVLDCITGVVCSGMGFDLRNLPRAERRQCQVRKRGH